MFAALKAVGANVQYTEFPDVAHDAWNTAYERADLFEWMLKQRRR
jgi:predicted peptidase